MKTSLKLLALFFAIALPSAFAAEFAGLSLPASIDPFHMLIGFVAVLSTLTAFSDYAAADRKPASSRVNPVARSASKSSHPLAA